MTQTRMIGLAGCMIAALLSGAADAEIVARVGSVAPEGTPWAEWLKNVQKNVKKKSNGTLRLKIFLAGKLGGEKEMVEDVKRGRLQYFGGSAGALASKYAPELNVLELPFLFGTDAEADFVLNKIRPDIAKILSDRGFVFVMWAENGWHGYGVRGKCIRSPEDMVGLKMRSQESLIHLETYKAFGASPVELPVPEVLSSLQTGVVDGYSNTPLFSFATSWHKGVDHFSYTKHIYQPALVVVSKEWFDGLSDEHKAIVMDRANERAGIQSVRELGEPLLENFTHAGVKVCRVSDVERKVFEKKASPVWDKFAGKSKANRAILNKVMAAKKEFAAKK